MRSPLLSSLTFALGFAPYLLGATLLSAIADRRPSREVLVVCQVVSCLVVGTMAVPGMPVAALLVLLLILGTVAPIFQGARAASLPDVLTGAGLGQVFAVPGLRPLLLLTWLPPAFAVAPEALAVSYSDHLGGGSAVVGLLLCAAPIGSVVGELLAGTLMRPQTRVRLVVPFAMVMFVPLLGFAIRPGAVLAAALLAVCGPGFTYAMGLDQRVLDATPEELRGRTLTLTLAGLVISQGLGFAAAGAVAEFVPLHLVVVGAAVLGLAIVLICGVSAANRRGAVVTGPEGEPDT